MHSDGTTHVLFEPLDFISRLVALIPKPRVNLTRFHGVFAPNSKYRAQVTLAKQEEAEGPLWVGSNGMDSSSPNRHLSATLVSDTTSQRKKGVHHEY